MLLRASFVAALAIPIVGGVAAPEANAIEVAPEPDAPLGDEAPAYVVPLEGFVDVQAMPVFVVIDSSTDAEAGGNCVNCVAWNRMYWKNYGWWESVGIDWSRSWATEVITRQNHHVALLNGQAGCYSGGYRYQNATPDEYGRQNSAYEFHTGKYTAYNDKWTQASGHNWHEDGVHWQVAGGADICKQF